MIVKHTEEHLTKINNSITKIKDDTEKFSRLKSQDAAEFWKALKYILEYDIKSNKSKINDLLSQGEDVPVSQLKLIQGFVTCAENIIKMVEGADDLIARATANIQELKKKATEIKSNIDEQ